MKKKLIILLCIILTITFVFSLTAIASNAERPTFGSGPPEALNEFAHSRLFSIANSMVGILASHGDLDANGNPFEVDRFSIGKAFPIYSVVALDLSDIGNFEELYSYAGLWLYIINYDDKPFASMRVAFYGGRYQVIQTRVGGEEYFYDYLRIFEEFASLEDLFIISFGPTYVFASDNSNYLIEASTFQQPNLARSRTDLMNKDTFFQMDMWNLTMEDSGLSGFGGVLALYEEFMQSDAFLNPPAPARQSFFSRILSFFTR
ncbi:MAG: hypothetical protein FWD82_01550 [Defluviitaleaceae bacterium]|nr:hypothetical protein [Defluviitaleaceae bacterium]